MMVTRHQLLSATLLLATIACGSRARGQAPEQTQSQPQTPPITDQSSTTIQPLLDFKPSDIKFNLQTFMVSLKDRNHEGWVLTAYPDPKTSKPLIGAGFSLDVMATDHPQRDPLNPHPFIEPSSAQLWQAAGLDPALLHTILDRFDRNLSEWGKEIYRRKIKRRQLTSDITEEEATRLLRISAVQAIENAKAYCRDFDRLTAAQQMAMSHLVFQMGTNLEEFEQFLAALNADPPPSDGRWKTVQTTLIESEWARHYTVRAASVIAMFDPNYLQNPIAREREIALTIHPPRHRHKRSSAALRRTKKTTRHNKTVRRTVVSGSR